MKQQWMPRAWSTLCRLAETQVKGLGLLMAEMIFVFRTLPKTTSNETKRAYKAELDKAVYSSQGTYKSWLLNMPLRSLKLAAQGKLPPSKWGALAKGRSKRAHKGKHTRSESAHMKLAKQLAGLSAAKYEWVTKKAAALRKAAK